MTKTLEFQYVTRDDGNGYWTLKDTWFLPYPSITSEETKKVPVPFYLYGLKPDSPLGWPTEDPDEFTNVLDLPRSFSELDLTSDHRKDLKRIEKKNEHTRYSSPVHPQSSTISTSNVTAIARLIHVHLLHILTAVRRAGRVT